jgi:hypothetical protein
MKFPGEFSYETADKIMSYLKAAMQIIRATILRSPIPEDPSHAQNTLDWLMLLWPDSGPALQAAALGHDIERAYPYQRVNKSDYNNYDAYKKAHAENSAQLLAALLIESKCPGVFVDQVIRLVERHEAGGDEMSDRLNQADSLSFFDNNLPYFYARRGYEETLARVQWGIKRLSPKLLPLVSAIRYEDDMLNRLVADILRTAQSD